MKKILILSLITVSIMIFSGCLEITPRNGPLFSGGSIQPWKDGTITLQGLQYTEKYDANIGDYRTAKIWFNVDYDVYINTRISNFHFVTNKGNTPCTSCWVTVVNGKADKSSVIVLPSQKTKNCGNVIVGPNDGDMWIDIGKDTSPGSFIWYFDLSESIYCYIQPDETITSFVFTVSDAHSSTEYSIPVDASKIEGEQIPPPSGTVTVTITKTEWSYDESGKVYDVWLNVNNEEPYDAEITIFNIFCVMSNGTKYPLKDHDATLEVISGALLPAEYLIAHKKVFDTIGSFDVDEEPKYIDFLLYSGTSFPYPLKDTYRIPI